MNQMFQDNAIKKEYLALVRGWTPEEFTIDKALPKENGTLQEALTHFKTIECIEHPWEQGKFKTSRYALIKAFPVTGRMHQIRRHLNHFRHPIIGDRPHGCNKQNKFLKEKFNISTMYLHAFKVEFNHPVSGDPLVLQAPLSEEFRLAKEEIFQFTVSID